jgi:bacteriocin biosynthesis cyclodehydratase domain-containing protein
MATSRAARPQIKPGLRRVWRDAATLQIGLTPDLGVIVTGLRPGEAALVDQLDGTNRLSDLTTWAGAHGLEPARVAPLLDLLAAAGVLTGPPTDRAHLHQLGDRGDRVGPDARAWSVVYPDGGDGFELLAQRRRQRVLVIGRGRLASAVQDAVRRTGAQLSARPELTDHSNLGGHSGLGDHSDLGGLGDVGDRDQADSSYRLVLLVGEDAVAAGAGAILLGTQHAHLAIVGGADRASVGPLVVPGRSACLRCVELHRTDRDPAWPTVAAQLAVPPAAVRGESSLTGLVAALAALQVACWLDQRRTPASVGATLTVTLPDGLTSRHAWTRHPRCGCAWLAASVPTAEQPAQSAEQATMGAWPTSPAAR